PPFSCILLFEGGQFTDDDESSRRRRCQASVESSRRLGDARKRKGGWRGSALTRATDELLSLLLSEPLSHDTGARRHECRVRTITRHWYVYHAMNNYAGMPCSRQRATEINHEIRKPTKVTNSIFVNSGRSPHQELPLLRHVAPR